MNHLLTQSNRIQSIDLLRGLVMVLMAIDHSRTFLHIEYPKFNAEDLTQTYPLLFFTRWITHFCAPVFIFLTGTSVYLMLQKRKSKKEISFFLITRGLWLIILELTFFRFCWNPDFLNPFVELLVIWAIGASMIFMALLIHLSYKTILLFGIIILIFHNLLPNISIDTLFWGMLYKGGIYPLIGNVKIFFLYPLIPYFGLIALGYSLGIFYQNDFSKNQRRIILIWMGTSAIILFLLLRFFNIYGDPKPWQSQKDFIYSLMAFLKTTKYPVSLLYALMTLSPALLLLAFIETVKNKVTDFFATIGSVPMFYYMLHLPAFLVITLLSGGLYKYNLLMVYVWFAMVVLILYLLCRKYSEYKFSHPEKWWLSYF